MIQLECSNCKTLLSIDDAFAGGVCRCQHCGTIQTVPKTGAKTTSDGTSQKALFKRKARIESALSPYNDGLDKAADEMDSSGALSANALANVPTTSRRTAPADPASTATGVPSPRNGKTGSFTGSPSASNTGGPSPKEKAQSPAKPPVAAATATPARSGYMPTPSKSSTSTTTPGNSSAASKTPMVIAAAVAGLAVFGVLAWLLFSGGEETTPAPVAPAATIKPTAPAKPEIPAAAQTPKPPEPEVVILDEPAETVTPITTPSTIASSTEPGIAGLKLDGPDTIFLLDRSGCTQQAFSQMVDACLKSTAAMGTNRKFQIVVWNNYQDLAFPADGLAATSPDRIEEARKAIGETYAGSTDLAALLKKIVGNKPGEVVVLSAVDLDETAVNELQASLKDKGIRLHGIAIGSDLTGERLKAAAAGLGGQFRQVDISALR